MSDFSAGEAIMAGFRVIRRRPTAILAWAAVYFVGAILPQGFVWSRLGPLLASQRAGQPPDPATFAAMTSGMAGWAPVLWVCGLAVSSVLYGAVFRAVLEPEDDRYLYLRLSLRELWLGLTMLALVVVFAIGCLIAGIVIGVLSRSVPGLVVFLLCVAAIVGFAWLAIRFSLATVMAFAERRFIFADVWPITSGHALKLFGVALAVIGMLIGLELAVLLPLIVAASVSGVFRTVGTGAPMDFGQLAPWVMLFALVVSLFGAVVVSLAGAPWASIYKQLTAAREGAA